MPIEGADAIVIITTTSDVDLAKLVSERLVADRLAGCVQVVDRISSTYRWLDGVENTSETLLLIKTTSAAFSAVERTIHALHDQNKGYETPEIIALPVLTVSSSYLSWLLESVTPPGPDDA